MQRCESFLVAYRICPSTKSVHQKMQPQPKENTRLDSLGPCNAIRIHIKAVSLHGLGIVDRNGPTVPCSIQQVIPQEVTVELWGN